MEDQPRSGSSWPIYLLGALFAVAVLLMAAWNIELPYLAFSPGPVSDAADAIHAEGIPVYDPEGELLMLTLVSQDVNIFEALIAGFDPTIDLVRRERYRPVEETDEEYRDRVLEQMDDSQQVAIAVALQHLGYELVASDVIITDLSDDVPASGVLEVGDSLNAVDGVSISRLTDLSGVLDAHLPGEMIEVDVTRGGSHVRVTVELVPREDDPTRAMIGISVREVLVPPFPLTIDTGVVGGPSAGMMHTLAIIDTLTEGEMTKGRIIAGTGTIRPDGSVGNIGGVRQKVVGAEAAGASIIFVPEGNYDEALSADRHSIEIVPVAHVDDAIDYLASLSDASY